MKFSFDQFCLNPRNVLILFLLIGLAAFAVILPTDFKTMDDLVSIINNPRIKSVDRIGEIFTTSFFTEQAYYRPLVLFTYMIEYHLFEYKAIYYNLTNVLLHIANAFLGFLILVHILDNRKLSFFAALIYLIHPSHWEAVANIPGRSILLCALFFLLGFHQFIKTDKQQRFSFLAILYFILALLSKEPAVMLPFCILGYLWIIQRNNIAQMFAKIWPFGLVIGGYFFIRSSLGINAVEPWGSTQQLALGMLTFLKACVVYVGQIIIPVSFYYDHSTALFTEFSFLALGVLIVWLAVLILFIKFNAKIPSAIKFFAVWIVLNFATVSQIVPIRAPQDRVSTADHFLYLPLLGAIAILVYFVNYLMQTKVELKPMIKKVLIGGYLVFLFLTLLQQNIYATNQFAMFKRSLEHHPGNIRVRNSLAVSYAYAGKYEEAEYHYKEALKVDPYNTDALIGSGKALADQGRYAEALAQYKKVPNQDLFKGYYKANLDFVLERLQ